MLKLSPRSKMLFVLAAVFLFGCISADAQSFTFNYLYSFEPAMITQPPEVGGLEVEFPEAARKNGVSGTVKASFTLGEDGKVRDIVIVSDLPHGVGDAVRAGLQRLYFKPAGFQGKPTAMKVNLDYKVEVVFEDADKNVTKPKITAQPPPVYPEKYRSEKIKGKVTVRVLFMANGEVQVASASSSMPREFDKAALEAAKAIKFTPAVHKKTKLPVSQFTYVDYDFKP